MADIESGKTKPTKEELLLTFGLPLEKTVDYSQKGAIRRVIANGVFIDDIRDYFILDHKEHEGKIFLHPCRQFQKALKGAFFFLKAAKSFFQIREGVR